MKQFLLSDSESEQFSLADEHFMGGHYAKANDRPAVVLSATLLVVFDNFSERIEINPAIPSLQLYSEPVSLINKNDFYLLAFLHHAIPSNLPPYPFPVPANPYGHLPFTGTTQSNEVFYRFESYPSSKRLQNTNGTWTIQKQTFAVPPSELPFVTTGLGAVARYALPSLRPARWVYEITPPPGTIVHYGASVPLFGQSGGGVEVFFPNGFQNVGVIQSPTVLPIF